jgi:hypothetical protein
MTWPKSRSRTSASGKSLATLSPSGYSTVGTVAGTFASREDRTEVAVADVEESDEKIQAEIADQDDSGTFARRGVTVRSALAEAPQSLPRTL